jgi:hypothetical protein
MGEGGRSQKRVPSHVRGGSRSLNLEDEILGGGGECNIPEIRCAKFVKIENFLVELECTRILNQT